MWSRTLHTHWICGDCILCEISIASLLLCRLHGVLWNEPFTRSIMNLLPGVLWTFYAEYYEPFTLSIMNLLRGVLWIFYAEYYEPFTQSIMNILRWVLWTFYAEYYEPFTSNGSCMSYAKPDSEYLLNIQSLTLPIHWICRDCSRVEYLRESEKELKTILVCFPGTQRDFVAERNFSKNLMTQLRTSCLWLRARWCGSSVSLRRL